jgi:tRNA/tmRNA/rRNA uracil-C5-methylase (TrmA/RlmC/RlmD family)
VQAERLIAYTASCVREKRVLDLYCGVGTIALHLADKHDVTGMEMNPQSIEQAHENAKVNELEAQFIVQSDDKVMDLTSYDAFVVDPPRAGLHPKFVERCIRNGPLEIVYVSCNPKSLATDLARLTEVYDVESIRCFDMFPQTPHIETVVVLKRKRISP